MFFIMFIAKLPIQKNCFGRKSTNLPLVNPGRVMDHKIVKYRMPWTTYTKLCGPTLDASQPGVPMVRNHRAGSWVCLLPTEEDVLVALNVHLRWPSPANAHAGLSVHSVCGHDRPRRPIPLSAGGLSHAQLSAGRADGVRPRQHSNRQA